ncbi:MAG: flagellar motor protein MotB [Pseudomonadota bacterium]
MRRKGKDPEPEEVKNPPWMTTFSDMILLMISFFIVLIAFGTFQTGRMVQFVKGFEGSFRVLPGGVKIGKGEQVIMPSPDIVTTHRDPGHVLSGLQSSLEESIKKQGFEEGLNISATQHEVILNISDAILFDLGSADINPAAYPLLSKVGDVIKKSSFSVRIEGHTDNLPIKTEQFPSNWELSTTRAVNVLKYYLETCGIPSDRLSALGHGEYKPLYPNDIPENRAKNRRVVIIFTKNQPEDKESG